MSPRPKKETMLDMASPDLLAAMEKPKPRQTRMRRSKGFEAAQRAKDRSPLVVKKKVEEPVSGDPFAESRAPVVTDGKWGVGQLADYKLETELPPTGRCTCGTKPITWTSKRNPAVGYYCSHVAHGGNGRFWTYPGVTVEGQEKTRRTRKPKTPTPAK